MAKAKQKKRGLLQRDWREMRALMKSMTKREIQREIDQHLDRDFRSEDERRQATPKLQLESHGVPTTRREFLGRGLIGGSTLLFAPGVLQLVASGAYAADCTAVSAAPANFLPFLAIDGAGGFSIAGSNFIVGANNDPMNFLPGNTAYQNMGLPPTQHPGTVGVVSPFGYPMHPQSRVAQGITQTASADALARTSGFLVACSSGDDSGNNPHNINQALAQAGLVGSLRATIGTAGNESGGNSRSLVAIPAFAAARAETPARASQLVSVGRVSTVLTQNQAINFNQVRRLLASVSTLAEMQTTKISDQAVEPKKKDVVVCGAQSNIQVLGGASVDILGDANIQALFPGRAQGFNGDNNLDPAVATAVKLLTGAQVGSACIEVNGCDYHGQGRPDQDATDLLIGQAIGRAVEYAHRVQKPLIIHLFTDGSVSFNRTVGQNSVLYEASSDNGSMSGIVMIAYNPSGRIAVKRPQLGSYGTGGVVANSTPWSNNPNVAARVIAANYLFLAGKLKEFATLFPNAGFNVQDVIAFETSIFPQV